MSALGKTDISSHVVSDWRETLRVDAGYRRRNLIHIGLRAMVHYRRGVLSQRKNDLWHFHPQCDSYPVRSFAITREKPSDDLLCGRCTSLARGSDRSGT